MSRRWGVEVTLLGGFLALTVVLATGLLDGLDVAVRDWVDAHRPPPARRIARALNFLGSANVLVVVALAVAAAVGARTGSIRPVLPVLVAFAVSHLLLGPIKLLTDRAAPHSSRADAVALFADPDGWSYPSGHVVNSLIWYPLLLTLVDGLLKASGREPVPVRARPALLVTPVLIISLTVTYLGYHWFTDTLAALLLGVALDRLLRRVPWLAAGRDRVVSSRAGR